MRIHPLLALVCGCALLASGAVGLRAQNAGAPGAPGFPYGDLKEVTLQGKVVSLQEEFARKYGARVAAVDPKQWVLATPEGQYYTFLETGEYRKLAAANLQGTAVEVTARRFPRSQILELQSYRTLPAETVRRRFHCGVCDIYTEDFGPCACCGKEMELIKQPAGK